jgi:bifunctional polynucleotide phosphatase/kinase
MAAIEDDEYRKPRTGMWDYLVTHLSPSQPVNAQSSIYVGDAAGRPAKAQRKKDFNDNDLKFALNIGCKFQTPEQFFLGEKDSWPKIVFNPKDLPTSKIYLDGAIFKGKLGNENIARSHQEMIIFVGSPGSGKSTFWKNYLENYIRVNNDTLKSRDRCLKVAENALSTGKSCVIDNTNPTPEVRSFYIKLAEKYNVPVRAFVFTIPKDLAFHLDTLRKVNKHRAHLSKRVGSMPIHKFFKDFVKPQASEGIQEVEEIQFIAGPFESEEERKVFFSYLHA